MILLNVLLNFTDGSQKPFTFLFDDEVTEITNDDIFEKINLFISKFEWTTLQTITCEPSDESKNMTIKYPQYIEVNIIPTNTKT